MPTPPLRTFATTITIETQTSTVNNTTTASTQDKNTTPDSIIKNATNSTNTVNTNTTTNTETRNAAARHGSPATAFPHTPSGCPRDFPTFDSEEFSNQELTTRGGRHTDTQKTPGKDSDSAVPLVPQPPHSNPEPPTRRRPCADGAELPDPTPTCHEPDEPGSPGQRPSITPRVSIGQMPTPVASPAASLVGSLRNPRAANDGDDNRNEEEADTFASSVMPPRASIRSSMDLLPTAVHSTEGSPFGPAGQQRPDGGEVVHAATYFPEVDAPDHHEAPFSERPPSGRAPTSAEANPRDSPASSFGSDSTSSSLRQHHRDSTPRALSGIATGDHTTVPALPRPTPRPWDVKTDDEKDPVGVGPYMIVATLGKGAVGTAYQGVLESDEEDGLPDFVAIKIQQRCRTPYIVDGSVPCEAWAMAQLRGQPNVAQLVAHVDDEKSGLVALIMEYIGGAKTLDTVKTLGPQHARAAAQQLLSVLAECERRCIVHGDVKPDNVVFADTRDDGEPQYTLIDFGAAQFPRARAPLGNALGESLPSDAATAARNIADEDSAQVLRESLHTNGLTSAQQLFELTKDSLSVSLSLSLAMDAPPDDGVITPSLQVAATPQPPPAYSDSPPPGQRPSHASSHPQSPVTSPTLAGSLRPRHRRLVRQVGAPGYAAPEIAMGSPISTASDMFSLGIVLFQVTCGTLPHAETGDVATWLETVFCVRSPTPPPPAIDSVSVSSADRGTGFGEGSLPSPASTAACAASPTSQLEGAQFPNWAHYDTDGTPPYLSPPCDTANAVADAATMHRQDSDLPPRVRATAVGQSAVVTAAESRMAAALVANGLDKGRWDLSGKDAWFPKLLVRLLQPEPFDRGSPGNALLEL